MNVLQATNDIKLRAALLLAEANQLTRDRFQIEENDSAEHGTVVHLIIEERDELPEVELRTEILEHLFIDKICYKTIDDTCARITGQRFKSALFLEDYIGEHARPVIDVAGDFIEHFVDMARVFVNDVNTLTTALADSERCAHYWAINLLCFYYCVHFLFAHPTQYHQLFTSMLNALNGARPTNLILTTIHRLEQAI